MNQHWNPNTEHWIYFPGVDTEAESIKHAVKECPCTSTTGKERTDAGVDKGRTTQPQPTQQGAPGLDLPFKVVLGPGCWTSIHPRMWANLERAYGTWPRQLSSAEAVAVTASITLVKSLCVSGLFSAVLGGRLWAGLPLARTMKPEPASAVPQALLCLSTQLPAASFPAASCC